MPWMARYYARHGWRLPLGVSACDFIASLGCPSLERLALPILPKIQGSPMTWGSLNRYSIVRDIHIASDNHYYYHIRYSDSRSVGTKRRYRSRVSPSRYAMEKSIPCRKGDRHSRPPALTLLSGLVSRMPAILRIGLRRGAAGRNRIDRDTFIFTNGIDQTLTASYCIPPPLRWTWYVTNGPT